jgi:hypothetical protein
MAYFAVLNENNAVKNVIVCDYKELAEQITFSKCVEYEFGDPKVKLGVIWNGEEWLPEVFDDNAVILGS